MATMKEQKNELVQMTREQAHCNEALPETFEVMTAAEAAKSSVPGCFSLTDAEYAKVKRESAELHTPPASDKSGLANHPKRK
jgi:hypothetical protein